MAVELPVCASEALAGGDAQLGEHFVLVPLDGARTDIQAGADFRVRQAFTGESGDLLLLRRLATST